MQCRLVTLIFLILLIVSCGGTSHITHEVRQPDGQPFPDPFYVLQTTDPSKPIRASFFFESVDIVEDLDLVKVPVKKFLDRKTHYWFSKAVEDKLGLTVRVLNPRNIQYKIFCDQTVHFTDGGRMDLNALVAYSDMKYREFPYTLPTWDGIKEVTYSLNISNPDGSLLISTGKFHYFVSQ